MPFQLNYEATSKVDITSGGIGKKSATVAVELNNAKSYDVDIHIYGKSASTVESASTVVDLCKFTLVLTIFFTTFMQFKQIVPKSY